MPTASKGLLTIGYGAEVAAALDGWVLEKQTCMSGEAWTVCFKILMRSETLHLHIFNSKPVVSGCAGGNQASSRAQAFLEGPGLGLGRSADEEYARQLQQVRSGFQAPPSWAPKQSPPLPGAGSAQLTNARKQGSSIQQHPIGAVLAGLGFWMIDCGTRGGTGILLLLFGTAPGSDQCSHCGWNLQEYDAEQAKVMQHRASDSTASRTGWWQNEPQLGQQAALQPSSTSEDEALAHR